jgi:hypothetical protein
MMRVAAPTLRRKNFDFAAKRRREIVLHARCVGAAETEELSRWLIAWHWYNPKARDPLWSLMECAKNMGGKITEVEASAITEEASIIRKCWTADNLARFLGVTYAQRQALGIRTIGSIDVKKQARRVLRQRKDRLYRERKRRANGVQARLEYEANSIAARARAEGVSRITIYRRRKQDAEQAKNQPDVTGVSAISFLTSEDGPVTPAGVEGTSERGFASKKKEDFRLATATTLAADTAASSYSGLPLELRLIALGLVASKNFAPQIGIAA